MPKPQPINDREAALRTTYADLPVPVRNDIVKSGSMCERFDARDGIRRIDLNGDNIPDYILVEQNFRCDDLATAFSGSHGGRIAVYLSDAKRGWTKALTRSHIS